jgi:hypothetical protein
MPNTTEITPELIRQAKYEGFIRHTNAIHDEKTTSAKFAEYVKQDASREQKFVDLRKNILEGLKS